MKPSDISKGLVTEAKPAFQEKPKKTAATAGAFDVQKDEAFKGHVAAQVMNIASILKKVPSVKKVQAYKGDDGFRIEVETTYQGNVFSKDPAEKPKTVARKYIIHFETVEI